jgi:hypothetical protein
MTQFWSFRWVFYFGFWRVNYMTAPTPHFGNDLETFFVLCPSQYGTYLNRHYIEWIWNMGNESQSLKQCVPNLAVNLLAPEFF